MPVDFTAAAGDEEVASAAELRAREHPPRPARARDNEKDRKTEESLRCMVHSSQRAEYNGPGRAGPISKRMKLNQLIATGNYTGNWRYVE